MRALLAAAAVVALASANLVFRVLLSGDEMPTMGDDMLVYYYPYYLAIQKMVAAGELPTWNPYQLCGVPIIASIQIGLFYPPHLLFLMLPVDAALVTLMLLHYCSAGIGCLVLARRLGFGWLASTLFALLFSAHGFYPRVIAFPNIVEVISWLPWGCVAVLGLARKDRPGLPLAGLAFCTGMSLLAGYPQDTVYSVYVWGALLLVFLGLERRPPRAWLIALIALIAAVGLGAMLAGPTLFPTYEVSSSGSKELRPLSMREMFPIGVGHDKPALLSLTGFVGGACVALLPVALVMRRHRLLAAAFAIIGALTLAFAAGPSNPFFDLYLLLPTLDSFRFPSRIKFVSDFCFSLVAAAGLDALLRGVSERSRGARPDRMLLVAAIAVFGVAGGYASVNSARFGFAMAVGVVIVAAWWGSLHRRGGEGLALPSIGSIVPWIGLALLGMVAFEVATSPAMPFRVLYTTPSDREVFHRQSPIYDFLSERPERVFIHSLGLNPVYPRKIASVHRFRGLGDTEPGTIRSHSEYFRYLAMGKEGLELQRVPYSGELVLAGRDSDPAALDERSRLLDLAATRYLLADYDLERNDHLQAFLEREGYRQIMKDFHGTLFENPRSLPRAYVTYRVEPAPPLPELLEAISRRDFDPRVSSFVEGDPGFDPAEGAPRRGPKARIVFDGTRRVEVVARLRAPGMLVLADTWFSGWRATVEGQEIEIRKVNHLFRGVPLPAGTHRVVFEYRPQSLRRGWIAAGVGAAGLALLVVLHILRGPSRVSRGG